MTVLDAIAAALTATTLLLAGSTLLLSLRRRPRQAWTEDGLLFGSAIVAATAMGTVAVLGGTPAAAATLAILLGGTTFVVGRLNPRWTMAGVVTWSMASATGAAMLAWVMTRTLNADQGLGLWLAGEFLLLLATLVVLLAISYSHQLVDLFARVPAAAAEGSEAPVASHQPFVSLHVTSHNDQPATVLQTLRGILALDYEDFEILMIDDNTADEALWRPVEEFCRTQGRIRFFHVQDPPEARPWALNFALEQTDPRAEIVIALTADQVVDSDFLTVQAARFADADVSFVRGPRELRAGQQAPYFRRLHASMPPTSTLIRKRSLETAGGWDEWSVAEEAELPLRLRRDGGTGVHVEQSAGLAAMPATFEAVKQQRFAWAFGGVQLLRMHWRSLMPWDRSEDNRLTLPQRWGYLVGALRRASDLTALVVTGFLLLGVLDLTFGGGALLAALTPVLVLSVGALVVAGVLRAVLVKQTREISWTDAAGAFGISLGLAWSVALGAARGLFAREGATLPAVSHPTLRSQWRHAVTNNRVETALAAACLALGVLAFAQLSWGAMLAGALLLWQGVGYAMAPLHSVAALRATAQPFAAVRRRALLPAFLTSAHLSVRRGVWPGIVTAGFAATAVVIASQTGPSAPGDLTGEPPALAQAPLTFDEAQPYSVAQQEELAESGARPSAADVVAPALAAVAQTLAAPLTSGPDNASSDYVPGATKGSNSNSGSSSGGAKSGPSKNQSGGGKSHAVNGNANGSLPGAQPGVQPGSPAPNPPASTAPGAKPPTQSSPSKPSAQPAPSKPSSQPAPPPSKPSNQPPPPSKPSSQPAPPPSKAPGPPPGKGPGYNNGNGNGYGNGGSKGGYNKGDWDDDDDDDDDDYKGGKGHGYGNGGHGHGHGKGNGYGKGGYGGKW